MAAMAQTMMRRSSAVGEHPNSGGAAEDGDNIPVYQPLAGDHMGAYAAKHAQSIADPAAFWANEARQRLHWFRDFDTTMQGGFSTGDIAWFMGGQLNASVCCIDQHLATRADQTALIWEGDELGEVKTYTYRELHREVCKIANAMRASGVKKGDTVAIYMPMIPELCFVMMACCRVGAAHSVVFAGFSAEALRDRIKYANSKWVFTSDEGKRGGRCLPLKKIVDTACVGCEDIVEKVFCFKRTGGAIDWVEGRDVWMDELAETQRPYCPPEVMDSEDLLFILFTSGSTGKPKGVAHTTAGYLLYAAMTCQTTFDLQEGDIYACVADCGWITGHSYIIYGPLLNGTTTVMFESTPTYPDHGRYWDMVQRHKITQLYTAPTAIRALMRFGDEKVKEYDRSSLRVLGTVGEPINPEAWQWYYDVVGEGRCSIVDTYWQTETGGHLMTPLPGVTPMKPGSCTLPFYGQNPVVLDNDGNELEGNDVEGILCFKTPWPGCMRTLYGDHQRYMTTYMKVFDGYFFTGDGCRRDKDGFYWITGRVDDVLNCSGHRIGTAEVESAVAAHESAAECAVVGFPHEIKGQGVCAYVILAAGLEPSAAVEKELKMAVRAAIGPFATPDMIVPVPGLPKTRSGKIMRRILRKVVAGEEDALGDTSTLADPSVVDKIIAIVKEKQGR